jgi:hypothetical protein
LQTETPDVGTTVTRQQLDQLPLSFAGGRSPESFAYKLTPGVEGGTWQAKINGSPFFSKEVLLDGASVTTYLSGHFGESYVSPEALGEFKIQTSGLSAEYGRTGGGVFNFVMRSGTNDWHGSAFGQLRSTPTRSSTTRAACRGRASAASTTAAASAAPSGFRSSTTDATRPSSSSRSNATASASSSSARRTAACRSSRCTTAT